MLVVGDAADEHELQAKLDALKVNHASVYTELM